MVNSVEPDLAVVLKAVVSRCDSVLKTASQLSRLSYRCSHDTLDSTFSPVDLLVPRKEFFTSGIVLEQILPRQGRSTARGGRYAFEVQKTHQG